jgi:hypothetical protein
MVGSLSKTNAFVARRFKPPMGQSATPWDIVSHQTSDAPLIHNG